jgi:hypothetical protein
MDPQRTPASVEEALAPLRDEALKQAAANVADAAKFCRAWLAAARLDPSTAHVVAMTRLVMDEAARLRAGRRAADGTGA